LAVVLVVLVVQVEALAVLAAELGALVDFDHLVALAHPEVQQNRLCIVLLAGSDLS
jgi:hypothetical protein